MVFTEIQSPRATKAGLLGAFPVANLDPSALTRGLNHRDPICGVSQPIPDGGADKEFDERTYSAASVVTVYRGIEASTFDADDLESDVRGIKEEADTFAVERHLQTAILNEQAEVLGGGTAVSAKEAVALLEQYAGERYAGVPYLHVNRYGTVFVPHEDADDDGSIRTKQGSIIVNGAGYGPVGPGAAEAAEGQFWVYATGFVNLWSADVTDVSTVLHNQNRVHVLAERTYAMTVQCFVAAVLATKE